jgi:hypothetical protein
MDLRRCAQAVFGIVLLFLVYECLRRAKAHAMPPRPAVDVQVLIFLRLMQPIYQ